MDGLLINGVPTTSLPISRKLFRIYIEHGLGLTELQRIKDGKAYGEPTFFEVLSYMYPTPKEHYHFYQVIVNDLFRKSAHLPFSFKAVTQRGVIESPQPPTPLFTYFFLKENLQSFQAAIETILADPHRLQCDNPDQVLLHEVSDVDGDVLLSILQSPETWLRASDFALSRMLQVDGRKYAPARVWQRLPEETYDTPENRFILHFMRQVLIIAELLPKQSWWKLVKNFQESKAIQQLTSLLQETIAHPVFSEVKEMFYIPFNSQLLMRRDGYRDLLVLWQQFHSSSQPLFDQWQRAMDVRAMHLLYELWVYFELINEINKENLGQICKRIDPILSDEDGVSHGSIAVFEDGNTLSYNQEFHPRRPKSYSYSMVLRPDYFWIDRKRNRKVVLDAKFSMNITITEQENDKEIEGEEPMTFREGHPAREDLYKMHTYRDAIMGTNAAVIIFPGTEDIFMRFNNRRIRNNFFVELLWGELEGIGALSRKPDG